ncbi:hydroxymethylbilane synthase [Haloferula luteola]|uniref:Porphobilinogen deaminase n=1 Tax=Haloferula luteola TaxID=595692 RepID=A0A840UZM3_9BACT|nr:hydroxymethylbilane synthase [Haloferula luteola]MBB5351195.1 hydroxymethylbilane synthase [Haloferula luteola]
MMMEQVRIGTRGSALALVQAEATERALAMHFPALEVVREVIKTTGDRRTDVALSEVAKVEGVLDKGVFTKELELALEAETIDIAVHSLKDVPTVLDPQFKIAGTLERAPIRDVLVSKTVGGLDALPAGAVVGTSSVRRAKQLVWLRPDVRVVDLRGNVPTRMAKAAGPEYDAIMLAEAGLVRLGHDLSRPWVHEGVALHFAPLAEEVFYPAAGQGAIGFEIRADDAESAAVVRAIHHPATFVRVTAEREFLRLLDAGCHTPVGVFTRLEGGWITMEARVFPEQGGEPKTGRAEGSDPLEIAKELFESLA